jgi:plastocyanin
MFLGDRLIRLCRIPLLIRHRLERAPGEVRVAEILGTMAVFGVLSGPATGSAAGQAPAGRICGRVTFAGTPPPPVIEDGGSQPVLYVDRSGALRYALVFLPDAQTSGTPVARTATMNQRRFTFEPQVLAVRAGATVRFTNDDPATHNVRARGASPENTFSIDTASGSVGSHTHRFAAGPRGRPIQLSCDIHPWMAAWIHVFDHDQFAVTGADGSFCIDNAPVGRYRVAVRQPSGPLARDLAVDVRAGETARLDVRFTPADVGMPAR